MDIASQPMRIIVDSALKTPPNAKILQGGNVLIAFAKASQKKTSAIIGDGCRVALHSRMRGKVCLKTLLSHLASREINEVLVEGGEGLNGALLAQNLIDELLIYYAPKLMGGAAKSMFAMPAFTAYEPSD